MSTAPPGTPEDTLVDVPKDGKTVGEVVMRGNIVMQCYLNDPGATRRAFRGGYFNSGDLAVWYPDGSISIQDRSKDIIISGGEVRSTAPGPSLCVALTGCACFLYRTHPAWP